MKKGLHYCIAPVGYYCLKFNYVSSQVRSGLLYYGSNLGRLLDSTERQAIVSHRIAQPKAQDKLPIHRRPKGLYDVGTVHCYLNLKGPASQPAQCCVCPWAERASPCPKRRMKALWSIISSNYFGLQ